MEKKPYVRIDFKNCSSVDYDYTICNWADVSDYIESLNSDFQYQNDKENLPEVKLTVVMLTDEEFEKWFIENVEINA